MRILHTADWHLGDRLGRIDRTADLRRAVERIAAYVQSENVDLLIIAGDLFSELARPDILRDSIEHLNRTFAPFLLRGGTMLAVTGNHDNETFCNTLRQAMGLASPVLGERGELVPPGRLYLATKPSLLRLLDGQTKKPVQFVLMPYPTAAQYLKGTKYATAEERNAALAAGFTQTLLSFELDKSEPAILIAHLQVTGADLGRGPFRLAATDDPSVAAEALADRFCYCALGHVHKAQSIAGRAHVRYSGSIEKMDLGESGDIKSCELFDIPAAGQFAASKQLPLESTPIYEVMIDDPAADLARLQSDPPGANDLVSLHVRYRAGRDALDAVLADLDVLFPRWYARHWQETGAIGPTVVGEEASAPAGFAETVREYLSAELAALPDADRVELERLMEELLAHY
jgi:DNA repair protein SbcD/Mre11